MTSSPASGTRIPGSLLITLQGHARGCSAKPCSTLPERAFTRPRATRPPSFGMQRQASALATFTGHTRRVMRARAEPERRHAGHELARQDRPRLGRQDRRAAGNAPWPPCMEARRMPNSRPMGARWSPRPMTGSARLWDVSQSATRGSEESENRALDTASLRR